MRKTLLLACATLLLPLLSIAQTASFVRPTHQDISLATSLSAVKVTLGSYTSNDARYRLYNGSNQYNVWDEAGDAFITATSYSSGAIVPGTPSTSTTFWAIFERGNNNSTTASFRSRLGPTYPSNYHTVALPAATAIATPVTLTGTATQTGDRRIILAYDAANTLISATASDGATGAFSLIVPNGTTITTIEQRTQADALEVTESGLWSVSGPVGGALPVELVSFTSSVNNRSARLNWTTASETNNLGFVVEQQTGDAWN
ncbi:MAG: hypothetical protein IAE99_00100, partial [Rhodothermales bacterium]|nr:hypothetical protein [Rhodothermales bacterium]